MSVTAFWYATPIINAYGANPINYLSDSMKIMLTTSSYTPNQTTNAFKSDVTNEVVGTGYTAGGQVLTSKTLTYSAGSKTIAFTAGNPSWPSSTITARNAVIYDATPSTDATRPLFTSVISSVDIITTGATFYVVFDPAGIATMVLT